MAKRAKTIDLLRVVDLLQEHITPALCRTVFGAVRKTERQRVWTLEALIRFWTAVVLRAPKAAMAALGRDTLVLGDRLYGTADFFAALAHQHCWGVVRRNRQLSLHKLQRLRKRRIHGGQLEDWLVRAGTGASAPRQMLRYIRWRCGWPRARAPRRSDGRRSNSRRRSSIPRSPRPPISTCIGNSGSARFGCDTATCISASSAAAVAGSGRRQSLCRSNTEPTTVARAGSVPRAVTGSRSLMCEVVDVSRSYLSGDGLYTTYAPPSPTRGDRHGPSVGGDALHAEVATPPVSSMPREQLRRNLSTQCRTGVPAATTRPSQSNHSTPAGRRSLWPRGWSTTFAKPCRPCRARTRRCARHERSRQARR